MLACERMKMLSLFLVLLAAADHLCFAQFLNNPIANLSSTWIVQDLQYTPYTAGFGDWSTVTIQLKPILVRGDLTPGLRYVCGFFCNGSCNKYLFAIFIIFTSDERYILADSFPQVVWSANRDHQVSLNSTLQLTSDGDLVLKDIDGATAWSTNTSGKSVVGMNMTETGNMVLYNSRNETVWQSFDYPTDALLPGQILLEGQSLTSSTSATNWARGVFSLSVSRDGLFAFIEADPPQVYYRSASYIMGGDTNAGPTSIELTNGNLSMHFHANGTDGLNYELSVPLAFSCQYIKLGSDGHVKAYEVESGLWLSKGDILKGQFIYEFGDCNYPMVCGEYGVCSNGQCSCLVAKTNGTSFFEPVNVTQPNLGCHLRSPLSCAASQYHELQEFKEITYFSLIPDIRHTNIETCREACARNCSCKAAFFRYDFNSTSGSCSLPSDIFSLMTNDNVQRFYNSTAFVKIQGIPPATASAPSRRRNVRKNVIVVASIGAFFGLFLLVGLILLLIARKRKDVDEEEYLDQVPGMPTRFSYEELKIATEDFMEKIGEGGFGSVFKGKLDNGTQIAVKLLNGVGHVKKSFLTEVEAIGSVRHMNLVNLIGFCAEKTHRGLVYEYMSNGSLENWIFKPKAENMLGWRQRRKIILDIAKVLSYLHEDCPQKILHLDIKPQNILLDEKFNAKVCDFGLSKLIDKDKSNVMMTMRGTPGYMAPEWLNSVITEKVDVYSFGIVVLEILCGRKNIDRSQADEEMNLLSQFKRKGGENSLLDLVDKCSQDMQVHSVEVVEMMKVAAWCLLSDFTKRPSMSVVVKVLEGGMDIDKSVDFKLVTSTECFKPETKHDDTLGVRATSSLVPPSVLSGPR